MTSKISDKGLRYDLTVPFARYVVMNQNEITFPFKRFQIQPVWRADRPQKGRYREFYQCDADIIGSKGLWNEIELTLLFTDVFKSLSLDDYVIKINHRAFLFALAGYVGLEKETVSFCAELDKIDKIGPDKVKENILNLGADVSRLEEVISLLEVKDKDRLLNRLSEIGLENSLIESMNTYFHSLNATGKEVKVELDLSLARGLSYYTGMIFEVKPTSVQMGSICGGGRYDDLAGVFGLKGVSGIGISFGLDRIYDVMEELSLFPESVSKRLDALIVHFSEASLSHSFSLVNDLRSEGIKADLYPEVAKIKKQFDYADKSGVSYTIVVGDDEMKSGKYMFKNMKSGKQEALPMNKIIQHLKG